jgi:hypothetical protein
MKFFKFLEAALSEDHGRPSSMRVNIFIVIVLFTVALTFVLIWTAVKYPELTVTMAGLYTATILGCLGLKKWQKDSEEKVPASPEPTTETK